MNSPKTTNNSSLNSRHDRFHRLAEKRTNEVLRRLDVLGNCANRSNYDYTEEEVAKIFVAIERKVREVKAKYSVPAKRKTKFSLK